MIFKQFKFSVIALMVVLVGCAGSANNKPQVPIEDRGVVRSAEPAQAVVVMPVITSSKKTEKPVAVPVVTTMKTTVKKPAVIALLSSAEKQKNSGKMQAAESSLERAQRIAPRDPDIYYQLADIRRLQGDYAQAEQLALKGSNMAIGDAITLRRIWLLIRDIRSQAGNVLGAAKAYRQAMSY